MEIREIASCKYEAHLYLDALCAFPHFKVQVSPENDIYCLPVIEDPETTETEFISPQYPIGDDRNDGKEDESMSMGAISEQQDLE